MARDLPMRIRGTPTRRPTVVFGSTLCPLNLPPRGPVRAPLHERSCSPPGNLEGSGRRGRGLSVGGMWHLRMRLAGSALRRRVDGHPPDCSMRTRTRDPLDFHDPTGAANRGTVSRKLGAPVPHEGVHPLSFRRGVRRRYRWAAGWPARWVVRKAGSRSHFTARKWRPSQTGSEGPPRTRQSEPRAVAQSRSEDRTGGR